MIKKIQKVLRNVTLGSVFPTGNGHKKENHILLHLRVHGSGHWRSDPSGSSAVCLHKPSTDWTFVTTTNTHFKYVKENGK